MSVFASVPAWAGGYIGAEWRMGGRGPGHWDCYQLLRAVLERHYGFDGRDGRQTVPDTPYAGPAPGATRVACRQHYAGLLATGPGRAVWRAVARPRPGDAVLLRLAGQPCHCGVIVAVRPVPVVLHCHAGVGAHLSALDRPPWGARLAGYYRLGGPGLKDPGACPGA